MTIQSFSLILLLSLFMVGCDKYVDVDLPASKKAFYPDNTTIRFRNEQTGEEISLKANSYSCHQTEEFSAQQGVHQYKRYHPELCGQTIRKSDDALYFLDHSISSESDYGTNWFKIYFDKSSFAFKDSYPIDTSIVKLDSIAIDNVLYYDVYVLANKRMSIPDHEIDSVYFERDNGILKLVSSNNETWVLLN
jgi:hypothetical protein